MTDSPTPQPRQPQPQPHSAWQPPQGWQPPTGWQPQVAQPQVAQPQAGTHVQPAVQSQAASPSRQTPSAGGGPAMPQANYPYTAGGQGGGSIPPWSPGWAPGWTPGSPVPPRTPTSVMPVAAPAAPADGKKTSHRVPAFLVATLMIVAAGVGIGVGHLAWPQQTASAGPVALSSPTDPNTGNGSGSTGTDQGGTGSTGTENGGSGSTGSGSTGDGSTGDGSGSTDNGGSGSTGDGSTGDGSGSTDNGGSGSTGDGSTDNGGSGSTGDGSTGDGSTGDGGSTDPNQQFPGFGNLPGMGDGSTGDGSNGGLGGLGGSGSTGSNGSNGSTEGEGAPSDVNGIADKVDDALVIINVTFSYQGAEGAGTGIVLTSDGEILTNNHVIDGATSIKVTDLANGKTYSATVEGYSKTNDIAVLQLQDASGLTTAKIADSSKVKVGDAVVGVGNAGGTGSFTPAGGSVTGLNESITVSDELYGTTTTLSGLIETNANIQSGDSGGSLVNEAGEVIGVDTAAAASNGSSATNQGYAVPINTAMAIVKQIDTGKSTDTVHVGGTAALGVLITSSDSTTGMGGLGGRGGQSDTGTGSGAEVQSVVDGGAAAKAGVDAGSVITELDGHAISSSSDLSGLMQNYRPGDKVSLSWTDSSGQSHTATVTLGTGPAA